MISPQAIRITQLKGDKFGLVSRLRKLEEAIWLTVCNEIFKLPPDLGPFCQRNYLFKFSSGYPNYPVQ